MKTFTLCVAFLALFGAISAGSIIGGKTRITDPQRLQDLADELSFYLEKLSETEDDAKLELIHLRSATVKVVAGALYEMEAEVNENDTPTDCKVNLWLKSWTNFVHMEVECGEEKRKYKYESSSSSETLGNRIGGYQNMTDEQLEQVKPKVVFVLERTRYNLKRMISGKQQVVAGMNYMLVVEATSKSDDEVNSCDIKFFENLKGEIKGLSVLCHPTQISNSAEPSNLGNKRPITDEDKLTELKEKIDFYYGKINEENTGVHLGIVEIKSATYQVVSGILYDVVAKTSENRRIVDCKIDLWEQPWTKFVRMHVECENRKYKYESSSDD